MKKKINCKARLHDWDHDPPGPGSVCKACAKRYGENPPTWKPGRKVTTPDAPTSPAAPPAKPNPAGPDLSKVLARWNPPAAQAAATETGTAPEGEQPPKKPDASEKVAKFLARPAADLTIWGAGKTMLWFGREPARPDPEWMNKFREGAGELLAMLLPDTEVGPVSKTLGAFGVVCADMWIKGKPRKELTAVEQPSDTKAAAPPERPKPELRIVPTPTTKEPETWRKPDPQSQPRVDSLAGAPSSEAFDPSALTFDGSQMTNLYAVESAGSAPGAPTSA